MSSVTVDQFLVKIDGPVYDWNRYWYKPGSLHRATTGFLEEWKVEEEVVTRDDVLSFKKISSIQCLILLGESGMGKSYTLYSEYLATKNNCDNDTDTLFIKLGSSGSENTVHNDVFESDEFRNWVKGNHHLHLFLDGLDECQARVHTVGDRLVKELWRYKNYLNRLSVRIACRTGSWDKGLEKDLESLFGKSSCEVYELAPLTGANVKLAALQNNLDPDSFLDEVSQKNIIPLAARPVTLKMLLNLYAESQCLPSNQSELYFQGCLRLCKERTEPQRKIRKLDEYQCLALAGRIAYISIFSSRPIIYKSLDLDNGIAKQQEVITINDLAGGEEHYQRNEFSHTVAANEDSLREVFSCGLFSRKSEDTISWGHLSYAEFLAAWYLKENKFPLPQVKSLIFHQDGCVIPQLYGTAYWVGSIILEIFSEITKTDPQILLNGGIEIDSDEKKAELTSSLLSLCEKNKLEYHDLSISIYGQKLNHPDLANILKLYINDSSKNNDVRSLALSIAGVCECHALQEDLVAIALSDTESMKVRIKAIKAICSIGDSSVKGRLKPLFNQNSQGSDSNKLQGYLLKALWPEHLSVDEVLNSIRPLEDEFDYHLSLDDHFFQHLSLHNLLPALNWIEKQQIVASQNEENTFSYMYIRLMKGIISKTLSLLENSEIIKSFSRVIGRLIKNFYLLYRSDFKKVIDADVWSNEEIRHEIFLSLIDFLVSEEIKIDPNLLNRLVFCTPLCPKDDFRWLVDTLRSEQDIKHQDILISIISKRFNEYDQEMGECLLEIIDQESSFEPKVYLKLRKSLSRYLDFIRLDSDQAKSERENYRALQEFTIDSNSMQNNHSNSSLTKDELIEKIKLDLDNFDKGDSDAWWEICCYLSVDTENNYLFEHKADLTSLSLWSDLANSLQTEIIRIAEKYIQNQTPDPAWLVPQRNYRPAQAGYRAFYLLAKVNFDRLNNFPLDTWKLWSTTVIYYSPVLIEQDVEICNKLGNLAYEKAPDEVINLLLDSLRRQNDYDQSRFLQKDPQSPEDFLKEGYKDDGKYFIFPSCLKSCLDEKLINSLIELIKTENLTLENLGDLIITLVESNNPNTILFTKSIVEEDHNVEEAILAASLLMSFSKDAAWDILWPRFQNYSNFGKAVIEKSLATNHVFNNIETALSETQLADFYIWMLQQYPYEEDPKHSGIFTPGIRDYVANFKSTILANLQNKGTPLAVQEIKRLQEELPNIEYLSAVLLDAQAQMRSVTWNRPQPTELLGLLRNRQARLIRTGLNLCDLIYESLERLENKLQNNENLPVFNVWNKFTITFLKKIVISVLEKFYKVVPELEEVIEKSKNDFLKANLFLPKNEDDLSSLVKAHLDEDIKPLGMIVSREVEINRKDFTDIRIDCPITEYRTQLPIKLSVIIEVKGSWNKDLNTSMKKQLFERYLSEIGCQDGIYLVGWFSCPQWSDQDYRKKDAERYTRDFPSLAQAKAHFNTEAQQLSTHEKRIRAFVLNVSLP